MARVIKGFPSFIYLTLSNTFMGRKLIQGIKNTSTELRNQHANARINKYKHQTRSYIANLDWVSSPPQQSNTRHAWNEIITHKSTIVTSLCNPIPILRKAGNQAQPRTEPWNAKLNTLEIHEEKINEPIPDRNCTKITE